MMLPNKDDELNLLNLSSQSETEQAEANEEFVSSIGAKKRLRISTDNLDLNYLEQEVVDYFVYPLTTLTGKPLGEGISVSKEKTTILVTTPEKGVKIRAFLADNDLFSITEFADPTDPSQQLLKNSNSISFVTRELKNPRLDLLYLLTEEKITVENFEGLNKFLSRDISIDKNDAGLVTMKFQPLEDFTSFFKSQVIKILLKDPIVDKIKEMSVTTPAGTLVGNIKAINSDGHTVSLLAKDNTEIFPNLVFPFQTKPNLGTVNYWNSKQIIPLKEIFDFLNSKNISYNQEFSLAEFLALGEEIGQTSVFFDEVLAISFSVPSYTFDVLSDGRNGGHDYNRHTFSGSDFPEFEFKAGKTTRFLSPRFNNGNDPNGVTIDTPVSVTTGSQPNGDFALEVEPPNLEKIIRLTVTKKNGGTSAFGVICQMLTESYWKDREFVGRVRSATKIENINGQLTEVIDDGNLYKLQQKYAGQDRYAVTTNIWSIWKQENPGLVSNNLDRVRRIESCLAMLSGSVKSNYSINKGDNDDYKILLPWYFEVTNNLGKVDSDIEYKDIIVKLKSSYGFFDESGFVFDEDNISKNRIYELDYNHFVFPELTKTPETAQIPSSMPLDQELANGEFSKYLLKKFTNEELIKNALKQKYGSGEMNYDPIVNTIANSGDFVLQVATIVEELEISSVYGYGDWKIKLLTTEDESVEINLKLFSKEETDKTLVSLII